MPAKKRKRNEDERSEDLKLDDQANLDELGSDPGQVGAESGGQSGSAQRLSSVEDANEESVEELSDTDQAFEAAAVEGVEDAADHPERPVHTHLDYGRPDDLPPEREAEPEPEDEEAA
jgi:hypothetical protein